MRIQRETRRRGEEKEKEREIWLIVSLVI